MFLSSLLTLTLVLGGLVTLLEVLRCHRQRADRDRLRREQWEMPPEWPGLAVVKTQIHSYKWDTPPDLRQERGVSEEDQRILKGLDEAEREKSEAAKDREKAQRENSFVWLTKVGIALARRHGLGIHSGCAISHHMVLRDALAGTWPLVNVSVKAIDAVICPQGEPVQYNTSMALLARMHQDQG